MNKISIAISVAALLMYGCSDDKPKEQGESTKTQKVQESDANEEKSLYGTSTTQPANEDIILNTPHIGVVLESINSGGYTYSRVDDGGNIYWIAGPMSTITKGTTISFIEQMVMIDFTSKSLNKKFESLMFVSAIVPIDKSGKPIAQEQNTTHTKKIAPADHHNHANSGSHNITKTDSNEPIKIAKNAKGYSVEEIYAKKDSLKDKKVKIDAQVVKVSKGIMGKDWVHLQDGSGAAGTNDIIATAKESTVQVGDKVTTDGVVKTNVDLGYGYKFSIIIDEAKFTYLK